MRILLITLFLLTHKLHGNSDPLVVVTCSGRSGSSTLSVSFAALGFETHHMHSLSERTKNWILERSQTQPVILIDSFRDIIDRQLSRMFFHLENYLGNDPEAILERYAREGPQLFQETFDHACDPIQLKYVCRRWTLFGYDALNDKPFDFIHKVQYHQKDNLYFINLRFKDIGEWEQIIRELPLPFDTERFQLIKNNLSETHWFHELYDTFKPLFHISKSCLNEVLERYTEELAHFMTEEEFAQFRAKWEAKTRD